jgi:hypothetical protein
MLIGGNLLLGQRNSGLCSPDLQVGIGGVCNNRDACSHPRGLGRLCFRHSRLSSSPRIAKKTFRGVKSVAGAGEIIQIPANALHQFQNKSDRSAHLLRICCPAGRKSSSRRCVPVATRTTAPPRFNETAEWAARCIVGTGAPRIHFSKRDP